MATGLPQQLVDAVNAAGAKYGVDPNVLLRIWHWETGGTFPNTAINTGCSGPNTGPPFCGGLFGLQHQVDYGFGTGIVNDLDASAASIQQQANTAAAEVAHLVAAHGGSLYQAILTYSGGSPNEAAYITGGTTPGGYSPGGGSTTLPGGTTPAGTPISVPVLSGAWGAIQSALGGAAGSTAGAVLSAIGSAAHLFFTSGAFWDPLLVLAGGALVLIGVVGLVMGHDSAGQTVGVIGTAAKAAVLA